MTSGAAGGIAQRLAGLPAIDQHCHAPLAAWQSLGEGPPAWRRCFTEAVRPESLATDVPASRGYLEFLRAMADFLELGPGDRSEAAVARRRDEMALAEGSGYLRLLFDDAGIVDLLVDTGYGGAGVLTPAALARAAGRPVHTIVRVESVAQDVLGTVGGQRPMSRIAFTDALAERLARALVEGVVGFKSIAAYRGGLDLPEPSARAVAGALRRIDRVAQARRLDEPTLVAHVVWTTARLAAERGVPLQFHTGFGDSDVHLPTADGSLLRPLLRDPATEACPIVLLHAFPFVAQAAYLASVYPQVHVDLSLAIPLLGGAAAGRLIAEALALCPVTKLLAASDGHSYPEMHWRGVRLWGEALGRVLAGEVAAGRLDDAEVEPIAAAILAGNSRRLYRLQPSP